MCESITQKRITLGLSGKLHAFKLFDILSDPEKCLSNKDVWGKSSTKQVAYDSLEYLKSISTQLKDTSECESASQNVENDDCKKIKRPRLKKMLILADTLISHFGDDEMNENHTLKYMAPCKSSSLIKNKSQNVASWFNKRKYQCSSQIEICDKIDAKRIKLEWSTEVELLYSFPDLYCQSNKSLTIDRQGMVFSLNINNWNEIEIAFNQIKSVTVYQHRHFIRFNMKSNVLMELRHLYDSVDTQTLLPIQIHPKKISFLKDVMVFFIRNPITSVDINVLKSIFGEDKVTESKLEQESSELLSNMFHIYPKLVENLLKNLSLTWSVLCKDHTKVPEISGPVPAINRNLVQTPKKSPICMNKSPINAGRVAVTSVQPIPGILLQQPCVKPVLSTVLCSPNSSYITNHIVIATTLANSSNNSNSIGSTTSLDPYPNLFNRMINEPSSIGQISVIPCSVATPTNLSFSLTPVTSVNTTPSISSGAFSSIYELTTSLANLNNSVPVSNGNGMSLRSMVQSTGPNNFRYLPGRNTDNIFQSFNYCPDPQCSVNIHSFDLTCLNDGQCLNDSIINFYLYYIRCELISEEQRERSYFFSSFFYTKLQGSAPENDCPETRYARVTKWTKRVDIFQKDFIIIPINETNHWFLAIICFPWMAGMISYDRLLGVQNNQYSEVPKNNSEFALKTRVERVQWLKTEKKIDPKPCILLFDSLQSVPRASNVKLIREYLKSEWDARRKDKDGPLVFDKNTIRGFNPQVPQQTNMIDCGIFVLHYVEMFFRQPLPVFTKEYFQTSLMTWFDSKTVGIKREFIQKLLLKKGEAYQSSNANGCSSENPVSPKNSPDDSGQDIEIL